MIWKMIADAAAMVTTGRVRTAFDGLWRMLGLDQLTERTPARQSLAFTMAFIALAAKMAKADGVATGVETTAFERCFRVPPSEIENVRRVFNFAKQDVAGFEVYAEQISRLLADDRDLLRDVFECLFHVAAADGVLHDAEEAFLKAVALKFGLSDGEYQLAKHLFVHDPNSPYAVLGLTPGATEAELKARHRQLVLEHHPDRLAAHGVPDTFRATAERKLAAINAAYDVIRKQRGTVGART